MSMIQAFLQAKQHNQRILEGVRTVFLLFNLVGCLLYLLEITLLGHWLPSLTSKIPYLTMLLGFVFTGLMLWDRKTPWIYTGFLAVMILLAATGVLGFFYHVIHNFEGKVDWSFAGTIVVLQGARPTLAPLAFTHIGLTGLLCAYKAH
jgi:hypothetical protein